MTDSDEHWWFCTRHNTVEPADTPCPGKDLLGPYPTREEAARALDHEGPELRKAEQKGKARAKEEDPALRRDFRKPTH